MTILAHSTAQHETPDIIDFPPDMLVVRNSDVSDPANGGRVPRFSDLVGCDDPRRRRDDPQRSRPASPRCCQWVEVSCDNREQSYHQPSRLTIHRPVTPSADAV